jgi:hypothetical protein
MFSRRGWRKSMTLRELCPRSRRFAKAEGVTPRTLSQVDTKFLRREGVLCKTEAKSDDKPAETTVP